jgi:DNA polymerase/3'-5' exonuclease PolX
MKKMNITEYTICGSYRRGKWWCNDIDIVVPIYSDSEIDGINANMYKLGWKLNPLRRVTDTTFSHQYIKQINGGIVVLDLFLTNRGSLGNAILFATGPRSFNDKIRAYLDTIGFTWRYPRYFTENQSQKQISFSSEMSTLLFLGIKWIKPKNRL